MKRLILGSAIGATLTITSAASAFCRTTICDPRYTCQERPEICCQYDANGCETNTAPLFWPTSCVSFNVHEDGSDERDISAGELSTVLDEAFDEWLTAECGGSSPSLAVDYRGLSQCGNPEYNQGEKERNANVWMFRDQGTTTGMSTDGAMELDDSALAVTTVSFNEDTAEIYDVDVELLSASAHYTTTDVEEDIVVDLASVVTHEAGHFLGLDHTRAPDATMLKGYFPGCGQSGSCKEPRSLSADDEAAICAAYPEGRSFPGGRTCEPRGKYSPKCEGDGCGCSAAGSDRQTPTPLVYLGALGLALFARRRRAQG